MEELIRRRVDVVAGAESERTHGELTWQILFLIERIDDIGLIIVLLGSPATSHIASEEEVGVEVGGGLR